jgi:hypothetical protein
MACSLPQLCVQVVLWWQTLREPSAWVLKPNRNKAKQNISIIPQYINPSQLTGDFPNFLPKSSQTHEQLIFKSKDCDLGDIIAGWVICGAHAQTLKGRDMLMM